MKPLTNPDYDLPANLATIQPFGFIGCYFHVLWRDACHVYLHSTTDLLMGRALLSKALTVCHSSRKLITPPFRGTPHWKKA